MREAANAPVSDGSRPAWQTFIADADVILRPRWFGGACDPIQNTLNLNRFSPIERRIYFALLHVHDRTGFSKSQANRINVSARSRFHSKPVKQLRSQQLTERRL